MQSKSSQQMNNFQKIRQQHQQIIHTTNQHQYPPPQLQQHPQHQHLPHAHHFQQNRQQQHINTSLQYRVQRQQHQQYTENVLTTPHHFQHQQPPPKPTEMMAAAPRSMDNSTFRARKPNETENKVTHPMPYGENIKTTTPPFIDSANTATSSMVAPPKINIQIKKRPVKSRLPIMDIEENTKSSAAESSTSSNVGNFNNIENSKILAPPLAGASVVPTDAGNTHTNNNLEQESTAKQPTEEINNIGKVLSNSYDDDDDDGDKTGEEDEEEGDEGTNLDNINPKSSKNTREKTPMCLINDLARFNKISFQYRLTSENGPAHCKRFTVTLKLGDEEYTAEGCKIKKAQHLAAKEAIEKTIYKHPVPKTNRRNDDPGATRTNITPTVELNALAMKLGQQTYYIFDPRQMSSTSENITQSVEAGGGSKPNYRPTTYESSGGHLMTQRSAMVNTDHPQMLRSGGNFGGTFVPNLAHAAGSGKYGQRHMQPQISYPAKFQLRYPALPPPFQNGIIPNPSNPHSHPHSNYFPSSALYKITLIVGTQKFVGIGRTLQQAKHDAASKALQVLKEQINTQEKPVQDESFDESDNKSPISLVFEIGIKRNLPVDFKVLREEGPAHMRTFTTACIVGHIMTEGDGTGKKISKKKAAQKMIEELKKLPPLTPTASPIKPVKTKTAPRKSAAPSAAKATSSSNDTAKKDQPPRVWNKTKKLTTDLEPSNPITKLIEWHQRKKEKEPEFKLISETGKENSRRRQFVMEVISNDIVARGVGNSKKMAKRDAAQNFLISIGSDEKDSKTSENSETNKTNTSTIPNKEVEPSNFKENPQFCSSLAPVPLITPTIAKVTEEVHEQCPILPQTQKVWQNPEHNHDNVREKDTNQTNELSNSNATVSIAAANISAAINTPTPSIDKKNETSSSSFVTTTANSEPAVKSSGLHMKDQLMYLAKLMGFEVDFSDYPKGNHNEFLTIVMLSTNPPQICHGVGVNATESQEDAAKNALKILSEMGLNNAMKS